MASFSYHDTNKSKTKPHRQTTTEKFNTLLLIGANIFAVISMIANDLRPVMLLALYAFQGIVVILLNGVRILSLKRFNTEGFTLNGRVPRESFGTKLEAAFMSVFIFLIFELVYLFFIAFFAIGRALDPNEDFYKTAIESIDWTWLIYALLPFVIHHIISVVPEIIELRKRQGKRAPRIGVLTSLPIKRILPMHFSLFLFPILFLPNAFGLIIFAGIKTVFDVIYSIKRVGHVT